MMERDIFLHPPQGNSLMLQTPGELVEALETATAELERTFPQEMPAFRARELLQREAVYSAAIEEETDPRVVRLHHQALLSFLANPGMHVGSEPDRHTSGLYSFTRQPLTRESLLELHSAMMEGQTHAQPGRYRSVGVIVGRHRPPGPALVPSLMDELLSFLQENRENRVARAVWAHVQFETIHPFADGNGRTGRALINHVLGAPIPLSHFIFAERPQYYLLFQRNDWPSWLNWMARGITRVCREHQENPEA